jgi:hypothetical protein
LEDFRFSRAVIYTFSVQNPATFYVTIGGLYKNEIHTFPRSFFTNRRFDPAPWLGSDSLIYEEKLF